MGLAIHTTISLLVYRVHELTLTMPQQQRAVLHNNTWPS